MHWVQDHEHVSLTANVAVGTTAETMKGTWSRALKRANSRAAVKKQSKATQAGADPGELKSDKGFLRLGRKVGELSLHYPCTKWDPIVVRHHNRFESHSRT